MPIVEYNKAINDNKSYMCDGEGHNLWPGPQPSKLLDIKEMRRNRHFPHEVKLLEKNGTKNKAK